MSNNKKKHNNQKNGENTSVTNNEANTSKDVVTNEETAENTKTGEETVTETTTDTANETTTGTNDAPPATTRDSETNDASQAENETNNENVAETTAETASETATNETTTETANVEYDHLTDPNLPAPGDRTVDNSPVDAAGNKWPDWFKKKTATTVKEESKKPIHILQRSINKLFEDNSKTNLPRPHEAEVRSFSGPLGKEVNMEFIYSNDEKTAGKIKLKAFKDEVFCPEEGEFEFGIDYNPAT